MQTIDCRRKIILMETGFQASKIFQISFSDQIITITFYFSKTASAKGL